MSNPLSILGDRSDRCIDISANALGEGFLTWYILCQIPTISPSNPGMGEWGMPLIGALLPDLQVITLDMCNISIINSMAKRATFLGDNTMSDWL